jgi:hypothetical protein
MPLDPSIINPSASVLQSIANPPPIPSYADIQAKQLALQNARLQSQTSALDLQQKRREMDAQDALNQALQSHVTTGPDGNPVFDKDAISKSLIAAGHGEKVPDFLAHLTATDKAASDAAKARADALNANQKVAEADNDLIGLTALGVKQHGYSIPAATTAIAYLQAHQKIDPAKASQLMQQIQANPDPTAVQQLIDPLISNSKAATEADTKAQEAAARKTTADTEAARFEAEKPKIAADTITAQQKADQAQADQANAPLTQAAALGGQQYAAAVQQQPQTVQDKLKGLGLNPTAAQVHRALLDSKEQDAYDNLKSEEQSREVANAIAQGHLNVAQDQLNLNRQRQGFDVAGGVSDVAKNIANYAIDPATVRVMLRTNPGLLTQIKAANPDWGEDKMAQMYGAVKTLAPGGAGPKAQTITALNTLMHHSDTGLDVVDALNNGSFTPGNAIYRKFSDTFGQPAGTDFNTVRNMIAGEFAKVAQGGAPHEAEVQAAVDNLKASNSPAQLKAGLNRMLELAGGRMVPLNEEGKSAGLTVRQSWDPTSKDFTVLQPSSKEIAVRRGLDPNTLKKAAPTSGPAKSYSKTATGPGGHKIGYDGTNWVDVQTGAKVQ